MAIQIIQGENATVKLRVNEKCSGKPYNFEGMTGASASFPGTSSPVIVEGSNTETNLLEFPVSQAQSALLKAGDSMDFEYRWLQDSNLYIERVEAQLSVLEQLF